MKTRRPLLKTTALALLLLPAAARAWGPVGHRAVAIVAQKRLTAPALRAIRDIFGKDIAIADVANCADQVKYGDADCAGVLKLKQDKVSSAWHFIDIPIAASPSLTPNQLRRLCPKNSQNGSGNCVVGQIQYELQALRDPAASRVRKKTALVYLIHFVGDEHQPLHCADDGDYGGNAKKIAFLGINANLHSLWDDAMSPDLLADELARWKKGVDGGSAAWIAKEKEGGIELAKTLEADLASKDTSSWIKTGADELVVEAARESFLIAKTDVYPAYAQDDDQKLGAAYQARMRPIAYDRLEHAGVRLAYLLNKVLGQAD